MITTQHILDTPLGWMVLQGNESHIIRCYWANEEELAVGRGTQPAAWKSEAEEQVKAYFAKERTSFSLPVKMDGSEFQTTVWQRLLEIPAGETVSYTDLADGEFKKAKDQARAIGGAVGANPLLLLVPCHRVIGSDGSITGYAGGIERKEWLLHHEGTHLGRQLRLF